MFKKHRSPVQGQKSKLVTFVAYALAGLLASGSVYAEPATKEQLEDVKKSVLFLTKTMLDEKAALEKKEENLRENYLNVLDKVKQEYPVYKDRFDAAEERLNDLNEKIFGENENSLYEHMFGKDGFDERIAANETEINSTKEALAYLLPGVAAQKDAIEDNAKAIADKASKKDLADGLTAVRKPLEALGKEVDTNKELIKATAETAEATGELVAALAPKVEANEKAIADNKTAIDKNFAETKENVNKLAEVTLEGIKALDAKKLDKADLANFEADAAKVKKAAAQISNKADRSEVVRLGNAVNADLTAVKNALNTKANQEDLQKVDARVTKVESVVEAQGTAIQSLNNRISGFGSQISDLHNKMEKLEDNVESGLAIQSAHAALFQPYRVGHVNVTAGLGGYKSKTALAVGVGYRFNERVAAKAGVAADTKGKRASYNLGVNFEF